MANLLDQKTKLGISKEYTLRITTILLFLVSLCIWAATILLIPAFLNSRSDLQTINYEIDALKLAGGSVIDPETQQQSARLNARTNLLANFNDPSIKRYIEYISVMEVLPITLDYERIDFLEVTNQEEGAAEVDVIAAGTDRNQARLQLSGIAATRSVLAESVKELQDVEWVDEVMFPLSDLGISGNIEFSISVTYTPNKIPQIIEYETLVSSTNPANLPDQDIAPNQNNNLPAEINQSDNVNDEDDVDADIIEAPEGISMDYLQILNHTNLYT